MNIEEAIELIQGYEDLTVYDKRLLDMAEAALVDFVNYHSDGPSSSNVERQIKEWSNQNDQ